MRRLRLERAPRCCGTPGSGQSVMFRVRLPSTASPVRLYTLRQRPRKLYSSEMQDLGQQYCTLCDVLITMGVELEHSDNRPTITSSLATCQAI